MGLARDIIRTLVAAALVEVGGRLVDAGNELLNGAEEDEPPATLHETMETAVRIGRPRVPDDLLPVERREEEEPPPPAPLRGSAAARLAELRGA